jgi:hypothetical protein
MTALQIVLAYIEAHGTASAAEIHAARPAMTRRAVQRALENLAYRRLIRKAGRVPREPGQLGAQCHRWEIQHEKPPAATVRQIVDAQPSLATVWAQPVKEAA